MKRIIAVLLIALAIISCAKKRTGVLTGVPCEGMENRR